jgi:DNA-binding transcriptional LysR family regulator
MKPPRLAPPLPDLHLLAVIADSPSLTQAAHRLGISKASVSQRLGALEKAVGMRLVRRTTRSITLTPAAMQFVEDTRLSFARIEQSYGYIRDMAGAPRGLLRISAPVAFGRQRVAPAIPEFSRRFPEIKLELDLTDRIVNLAQDGIDLAIRHARRVPDSCVAIPLCTSRTVLVASHDYLRRRGQPTSPLNLAAHDCLVYLREAADQQWSFEAIASRKRTERVSVSVDGSFKANNSEVLREAVLGGLGVGLLPDFSAERDLRVGTLVQLLSGWRPVDFFGDTVYAIRPAGTQTSQTVRCAIDYFRHALASVTGHP